MGAGNEGWCQGNIKCSNIWGLAFIFSFWWLGRYTPLLKSKRQTQINPTLFLSESESVSHFQFFGTPQTVACQAPLSMEFFRQEYWSWLPFPILFYFILFYFIFFLRQDTLLLYNPKECGERKKVCPFFLLNSRPLSLWGPLDFLSTCLGNYSLIIKEEG